jgi:hypothetical protein
MQQERTVQLEDARQRRRSAYGQGCVVEVVADTSVQYLQSLARARLRARAGVDAAPRVFFRRGSRL